jgi:hypothetical protein
VESSRAPGRIALAAKSARTLLSAVRPPVSRVGTHYTNVYPSDRRLGQLRRPVAENLGLHSRQWDN